jgi:hypothetical protein
MACKWLQDYKTREMAVQWSSGTKLLSKKQPLKKKMCATRRLFKLLWAAKRGKRDICTRKTANVVKKWVVSLHSHVPLSLSLSFFFYFFIYLFCYSRQSWSYTSQTGSPIVTVKKSPSFFFFFFLAISNCLSKCSFYRQQGKLHLFTSCSSGW